MKLNTFAAGDLSVETLLPMTEDVVKVANRTILTTDALTESMKTADNLNKVFFLTFADEVHPKNCFYKLVVDTYDESTGEYTYKFIDVDNDVSTGTLSELVRTLEDYPRFKDYLPQPGSAILVDYIFDDQTYGTKADVQEHLDELGTLQVPFTILGYNKTIPQYVKYRYKTDTGFDYKYVSSVDDKSVDATVDGVVAKLFIKHSWENANKIDENDCTGLLRPIVAGCKTYTRSAGGFAQTSQFTETEYNVESVSKEIARNILAKDGGTHTYGNNNPYDCPMTITVDGKIYVFCGYTVTVQSTNLLTGKFNGTYNETIVFDEGEDKYAVAANKYEAGKEYYKRNGLTFTAMSPTVDDIIAEEDVYEYNSTAKTMTCKSAYVQAWHEYGTELSGVAADGTEHLVGTVPAIGMLITNTSLSVENNNYWDTSGMKYSNVYGCNKWCQSNVRTFMNFEGGKDDYAGTFVKKNPFDKNSTSGMANGNSFMLKFAKDADFLKYVCPTVNRNAVPDKQYNTMEANASFRGSFVAYKQEEKASITGGKVNVSHDVDKFFQLSYTSASFMTENKNFDRLDATSDFTDVYPTGNNVTSNQTRKKYKYLASGELNTQSNYYQLQSPNCNIPHGIAIVNSLGGFSYNYAISKAIMLSPACTLY